MEGVEGDWSPPSDRAFSLDRSLEADGRMEGLDEMHLRNRFTKG